MNEKKLIGEYRPIRSDEYVVGTSLAITQYKSDYNFPLNNRNLGVLGKHLAIAHDTGVPVKELSLVLKPATWGFFLFDLRHALSWYWLFPIFISINGVFLLLHILFQQQVITNFLLSLCLTFSYHSVAWSFWPAYQIGLAAFATAAFILIFDSRYKYQKIFASFLLAISSGAFVLTLYLPRIIPVATFFSFILLANFIKKKDYKKLIQNLPFLILAFSLVGCLLTSWFVNNYEAIQAMLNSTYPGLRRAYYGGNILWDEFSGWLNPVLLRNSYGFKNSSEVSTYCSFLFPILTIIFFLRKEFNLLAWSIIVFILFNYTYLYIGIPEIIGKISFWNRTTARAIIGLDLAQIFMFAWFYQKKSFIVNNALTRLLSVLFVCFIVVEQYIQLPIELVGNITQDKKNLYISIGILIVNYYFILNKIKYFAAIFCISLLYTTLLWNPICLAPSAIRGHALKKLSKTYASNYNGKFVVATGNTTANIVAMLNIPVLNVTSHYIDQDIFETFYKDQVNSTNYNKYHHMLITISDQQTSHYESAGDWISLNLSALSFDFTKFKADILMTYLKDAELLKHNKTLKLILSKNNFAYFKILHQ